MKDLIFSLNATIPVFMMIILGMILRRIGWIDQQLAFLWDHQTPLSSHRLHHLLLWNPKMFPVLQTMRFEHSAGKIRIRLFFRVYRISCVQFLFGFYFIYDTNILCFCWYSACSSRWRVKKVLFIWKTMCYTMKVNRTLRKKRWDR